MAKAGNLSVKITVRNGQPLRDFCEAVELARELVENQGWTVTAVELHRLLESAAKGLKPGESKPCP